MFNLSTYIPASLLLLAISVQAFTPHMALQMALHPPRTRIDYGIGYNPKNRPSRQLSELSGPSLPAHTNSVSSKNNSPPTPDNPLPSSPLHYGVLVLKVCLEGKTVETEMVPTKMTDMALETTDTVPATSTLRYATSAYDPKSRE
ncbi:MAG: hypothetical protein CMM02_07575 [Rhodopirellula sp.]|nr:hypothetical protein [Rhodopirellula sp.]